MKTKNRSFNFAQGKQGSALVFSLVLLSLILVAALGVASVSVIEQKNASSTGKSTQAFQAADSAVEIVMREATIDPMGTDLRDLANKFSGVGPGSCSEGVISGEINGHDVELSFEREDTGTPGGYLPIDGPNGCDFVLSQVASVKAVGKFEETTRAIKAAVAIGSLNWQSISAADFDGNWTNSGAGADAVRYALDSRTGIVYLRGTAHVSGGGTDSGLIFTIPSGNHPAVEMFFAAASAATDGAQVDTMTGISIDTNGEVTIPTAKHSVSMDGIFFYTN